MSMTQGRSTHVLSTLHVCAMLALAAWWVTFFWKHSPARDVFELHRPRPTHVARAAGLGVAERVESLAAGQNQRLSAAARAAMADISYGLGVLVLFAVGTGVYVRRLEIWLQARSSGQAMSFGGTSLSDAALAANAARPRGER